MEKRSGQTSTNVFDRNLNSVTHRANPDKASFYFAILIISLFSLILNSGYDTKKKKIGKFAGQLSLPQNEQVPHNRMISNAWP